MSTDTLCKMKHILKHIFIAIFITTDIAKILSARVYEMQLLVLIDAPILNLCRMAETITLPDRCKLIFANVATVMR